MCHEIWVQNRIRICSSEARFRFNRLGKSEAPLKESERAKYAKNLKLDLSVWIVVRLTRDILACELVMLLKQQRFQQLRQNPFNPRENAELYFANYLVGFPLSSSICLVCNNFLLVLSTI